MGEKGIKLWKIMRIESRMEVRVWRDLIWDRKQ